jgi:hypothetical protein
VTPIELRVGELHATAHLADGVLSLCLTGTADATTETPLHGLLSRLHAELRQTAAREARVDLRALEFMNSSCFKAFVTWIVAVDKLPAEHRHRIRFLCNPASQWQKRSLRAMTHFGGGIVSVECG